MNDEFRLIHVVVDNEGKLIKLESESSNVLFAVTQQSRAEVNMLAEGKTNIKALSKLIGIPSTTNVDLQWVKEKINKLVN
ncbi:hypothetical protein [Photobacterium phosphoreum]|uniref:hypothetical protein n=1 Tax=Photobacterium phosphoreum TaxID=659 RepID=UPI0007F91A91|nr:hypothetical protein [Photobacterium phosphoreum]OBU36851.1 hypothetical protein AYY24_13160 [Photobacterium phosphoreum]PSW38305.1 hypothetical protein CTM87_04290 [Photobacterium phosphoreum]